MTGEELWASILQEAISDRLVPQLDSEPEVEQIGEAPNEVPFDIPKKWKWVQIRHLVIPAKQKISDKDFKYIDVSSIDSSKNKVKEYKYIPLFKEYLA